MMPETVTRLRLALFNQTDRRRRSRAKPADYDDEKSESLSRSSDQPLGDRPKRAPGATSIQIH
jgi:hypothetical protein